MAFRFESVVYTQFDTFGSLNLVSFSVIGGIGYVGGAIIGSTLVPGGLISLVTKHVEDLDRYLIMASGFVLILTLIQHPNGVSDTISGLGDRLRSRWRRSRPERAPSSHRTRQGADQVIGRSDSGDLVVESLSVTFGTVRAVDGVDLHVHRGRIVGLIGPNGAGKTTLIDAVSGFVRSSTGTTTLGDVRVDGRSARSRSRLGIGRCFQTVELFDDLTVRENLLAACEHVPWHAWLLDVVRPRRDGLPDRVEQVVRQLGIEDALDVLPPELSYGDRKLVGVARALATGPSVLLLDEPAAGLNSEDSVELGVVLRRVADELGIGILLVEHDVDLVSSICDELVVMEFGRRIAAGDVDDVLANPIVVTAYLGAPVAVEQVAEIQVQV